MCVLGQYQDVQHWDEAQSNAELVGLVHQQNPAWNGDDAKLAWDQQTEVGDLSLHYPFDVAP